MAVVRYNKEMAAYKVQHIEWCEHPISHLDKEPLKFDYKQCKLAVCFAYLTFVWYTCLPI